MSVPQPSNDAWKPCSQGTLRQFAGKDRMRRRRQFLAKAGSAAGLVLIAGATGYWAAFGRDGNQQIGGIPCEQIPQHLANYLAGKLDQSLAEKIRIHIEGCPKCQEAVRRMSESTAQDSSARHTSRSESCTCAACRRAAAESKLA